MQRPIAKTLAFSCLCFCMAAPPAGAATFVVDTSIDATDALPGDGLCDTGAGTCSVRAAVQEANETPGADAILLGAGVFSLTLAGNEALAAAGDLDVTEDLTISGAGQTLTTLSTALTDRLFEVIGGVELSISSLTLSGGDAGAGGLGGAVLARDASSVIALDDVTLTGNHASSGGAIMSMGTAYLLRVTVVSNDADFAAGGAALQNAEIRDSSFGDNTSQAGSIYSSDVMGAGAGAISIFNSTFDGTVATLSYCLPPPDVTCADGPTLDLRNVTVRDVQRYEYSSMSHGPTRIRNSIVLGCGGILTSEGYNLFETSACTITGDPTGNQIDVPADLHAFGDYGGPTPTRPPKPDSTAVDAADPSPPGSGGSSCEPVDQRQQTRPLGVACDIGAVETACGDGVVQGEEECDDADPIDGDGCDSNCTFTACGNGIATAGETCDDGNTDAGDCCSPTCTLDAPGTACHDDSNECTIDECDGLGACLHVAVAAGADCDDGSACTSDDQCNGAGSCEGTYCDFCHSCNPLTGCFVPDCNELAAERAKIKLKHASTPARDSLRVSWKSGSLDKTDLPDPGSAFLRLCLYDGADRLIVAANAEDACTSTGDCWTDITNGYKFKDKSGLPDGLTKIKLKAGNSSRMKAAGKGTNLDLGDLSAATPIRMRLFRTQFGSCVAANFTTALKNTAEELKAKLP
jgi:cysteine-rich repeat protein